MTNTMKMLLWDNFHSIFLLFSLPFTFPFLGFFLLGTFFLKLGFNPQVNIQTSNHWAYLAKSPPKTKAFAFALLLWEPFLELNSYNKSSSLERIAFKMGGKNKKKSSTNIKESYYNKIKKKIKKQFAKISAQIKFPYIAMALLQISVK